MRTAFAVTAFAAAAFAQSQSSSVDPFPQTSYLQQTNSLGVVTGQPAAATSIPTQPAADTIIPTQPAVVTSQPAADTSVGLPASIPAVAPGIYTIPVAGNGNSTRTLVVSANNSTTIVLNQPTSGSAAASNSAKATGSGASGSGTGRPTGSSTVSGTGAANSAGAAANLKVAAGSMVGFGAFVAAFFYIHGGAWRDPTQDARCVEPTLTHLIASHASTIQNIAGVASLNYRLSPYPSHPTSPSSPSDSARNATHPEHVRDVAAALAFLKKEYGVQRWVGAGHSCGATLLLQLVSGIGLRDDDKAGVGAGPEGLVLLCGIYNVPLLLRNHDPPACPDYISKIYYEFIAGAFGADSEAYRGVSPIVGKYDTQQWKNGKLMVLAHSYQDELIERQQRDVMCVALDREGWSIVMEEGDGEAEVGENSRVLEVRDLKGGHDWIWEDGAQVAKLLADVIGRLIK
ncbi:hypothetical protein N0V95_002116 [Ascochyta clinopodiicola]|nr:hypothetical protein N0V95_002116 [Ascochyta clinopodiicola]